MGIARIGVQDTIEYKIGEIFSELKNRIQRGYNLREVINRIDEPRIGIMHRMAGIL